jgi:hypothetical protein
MPPARSTGNPPLLLRRPLVKADLFPTLGAKLVIDLLGTKQSTSGSGFAQASLPHIGLHSLAHCECCTTLSVSLVFVARTGRSQMMQRALKSR